MLFTNDDVDEIVMFISAFNTNERIETQQGKLSICTNPLSKLWSVLESYKSIEDKLIISKEYKEQILIQLYAMNINAKTLFPGLDGLGKSMAEYGELWDSTSIII